MTIAPPQLGTASTLVAIAAPRSDRRRRWRRLGGIAMATAVASGALWLAVPDAAIEMTGLVSPLPTVELPADRQPPDWFVPPPPRPGFVCGPWLLTYTVDDPGHRGVRCVKLVAHADGSSWLAWYGEGVRAGLRYRVVGEGQLGGRASAAELSGNGEESSQHWDDTLRVRAEAPARAGAATAGSPPDHIAISGAATETWVRTERDLEYTSALATPIRACGAPFARYRAYQREDRIDGYSIRCVLPGGRTLLSSGVWRGVAQLNLTTMSFERGEWGSVGADICADPGRTCYGTGHGSNLRQPRVFPGIGAGFEQTGVSPEWWFPSSRRYGIRLHAVRVLEDSAGETAALTASDVRPWIARADELLAPAGIDVFFLGEDGGPDFETMRRVASDRGAAEIGSDEGPYLGYSRAVALQHASKVVVFFRDAGDPCSPVTTPDAIVISLGADARCATPRTDRLGRALAAFLDIADIAAASDQTAGVQHSLTTAQRERLERRLHERRLE